MLIRCMKCKNAFEERPDISHSEDLYSICDKCEERQILVHDNNYKEVNKMVYEENNPGFAKFENEDDFVEGTLIKIEDEVGENKSWLYTLEVDGKPTNVWGSTILDQRMVGIKLGDKIKIVYKGLGEAKGGRNAPKIFQVLVDRSPSAPEVPSETITTPDPTKYP